MHIRIKNWKLAIIAVFFFCLFIGLGNWQLARAKQKKILLKSFAIRTEQAPLVASALSTATDLRFYRATLTGVFDNEHSILLDNKTQNGKIGYEIYTPFKAREMNSSILVDRGFVQITDRKTLPSIKPIIGKVTITGMLNLPPTYMALGAMQTSNEIAWPLRVEYINLSELQNYLTKITAEPWSFYSYLLLLPTNDPHAYAIEWRIVTMGPERHMGYALQWFALALTLLILFACLNISLKH